MCCHYPIDHHRLIGKETDQIVRSATGEPAGNLWRAEDHDYSPDSENSARTNAALITLVRNEELNDILSTMRDLERTWNNKFNYPYIFFNDKPFTEEFKQKTQAMTSAKCQYGTVISSYFDLVSISTQKTRLLTYGLHRIGTKGTLGRSQVD